jgi:hypothetical protein
MADDAQGEQVCRRLNALKALRMPNDQTWRECFDYTYPLRGSGFNSSDLDARTGQQRKAQLLDGTGTDSARILASGIVSGSTPANALWFKMAVPHATDEEAAWLDESSETLWTNIHAGTFDAAAFECAIDYVCAGWFALYVDEDRENGGFIFEQWPLSQCYCATTKPGGAIDTIYREYDLTAEQAVAKFGAANLSDQTNKLAKEKPDELVCFVHAIYPRTTYVADARLAKNLPIASCHVEVKAKKLVRESGYHEMPVIVPRWMLLPKSVYAVGPTFDALPDLKTLNQIVFDELANADIAIAGMWIAEDDGVLNPRTVKLGPRKIIVANSVDSMKPLETGADFNIAFTEKAQLQKAIRKIFMADQLEPQDGPVKTATEIHVRVELIRQLLGPTYGRMQAEYLRPFLTRCFGIAFRASLRMWAVGMQGIFNPPPESLRGREFTAKFISPLARAQSLEEVSAMDRQEATLINQAQVKTDVLDTYDWDQASRERGRLLGVPAKLIRSADDVEALRQQRSQQQQQAQAAAAMQQAAATAVPKIIEKAAA